MKTIWNCHVCGEVFEDEGDMAYVCDKCKADARLGGHLRENLSRILEDHLQGAMFCTRVWEAWSYGTMTDSDFEEVDLGRVANEILASLEASGRGEAGK